MHYLSLQEIEKIIRDNKYPYFRLYNKQADNYDNFKLIKQHIPWNYTDPTEEKEEDKKDAKKKPKVIPDSITTESIEDLNRNLEIFADKPGFIFQIDFRYSIQGSVFGPFIFCLPGIVTENSNGLNGNHLPDFKSSDDYIDFRIGKANLQRDMKEFHARKAELDSLSQEFETKKINPAALVASKAALYAWDVISKNVLKIDSNLSGIPIKDDEPQERGTSGTEDEDTKAASDLANDLIASGLNSDQIKELHRVAKEKLIPNLKSNGNKDQETD